jgi:hypothetical protein
VCFCGGAAIAVGVLCIKATASPFLFLFFFSVNVGRFFLIAVLPTTSLFSIIELFSLHREEDLTVYNFATFIDHALGGGLCDQEEIRRGDHSPRSLFCSTFLGGYIVIHFKRVQDTGSCEFHKSYLHSQYILKSEQKLYTRQIIKLTIEKIKHQLEV